MVEPEETERFASATAVLAEMKQRGLFKHHTWPSNDKNDDKPADDHFSVTVIHVPHEPNAKIKAAAISSQSQSDSYEATTVNCIQAVSGHQDGTLYLWNRSSRRPLGKLHHPFGAVNAVAFSVNGQLLASGGDNGTCCLWSVKSQ